jgi:hypothetical protein
MSQHVLRQDEDEYWYVVPVEMLSEFDEWAWVAEDGWPNVNTLPLGIEQLTQSLRNFVFEDWQWGWDE